VFDPDVKDNILPETDTVDISYVAPGENEFILVSLIVRLSDSSVNKYIAGGYSLVAS